LTRVDFRIMLREIRGGVDARPEAGEKRASLVSSYMRGLPLLRPRTDGKGISAEGTGGMCTKDAVEGFLAQRELAVAGVSGTRKKFGNSVYRDLKTKGYRVFAVNPNAETVEGDPCYHNLNALPDPVQGVVIVVPPSETEKIVEDAARAGIRHIWIQQGAESDTAIEFCREQGMNVVHGECILMFAEPVGFLHRVHRWIRGMLGKLPE